MDFVALTITAAAAVSQPSTQLQRKRPDPTVSTPHKFGVIVAGVLIATIGQTAVLGLLLSQPWFADSSRNSGKVNEGQVQWVEVIMALRFHKSGL